LTPRDAAAGRERQAVRADAPERRKVRTLGQGSTTEVARLSDQ
jgi:hypothetical protein